MNKKHAAILLIAFLAALTTTEIQLTKLVNANFIVLLPTITIRRDGTVEPETEYINKQETPILLQLILSENMRSSSNVVT